MRSTKFFARQARKPTGLFGRLVMSRLFAKGNVLLNGFVKEQMAVEENDHILEIGFGPGKLLFELAEYVNEGIIEGIDFSDAMITTAQKRNKKFIGAGKVKLHKGNFDEFEFEKNAFTKICSVNTLYFWHEPQKTVKKMFDILKPCGKICVGFADKQNLQQSKLDTDVFRYYTAEEARELFLDAGLFTEVKIETRKNENLVFNCIVATK